MNRQFLEYNVKRKSKLIYNIIFQLTKLDDNNSTVLEFMDDDHKTPRIPGTN